MKTNIQNLNFNQIMDEFKKALRENGLKYTKQREVLLEILYNSDLHFTPEALHAEVKAKFPKLNVGIATVYRTLNLLEDSGMATSISFGAQGKKFELAHRDHHDHLICKNCNKIVEFEDHSIEKKQVNIAKANGFTLTGHLMQLYGICNDCAKKRK
ncbi:MULTISPECIES: Fur family transcriptional regulator [unclassified Campylobacter]|uniref:Fur family transcriptional regulator n=1 Tax=unclassified Campylobacter TaxID=2593542 RepID=UPI0022E9B2AC|nr:MULTISPECIES: Fur family transcriptional regulator [unclassified Campylobacter]MBQ2431266.1 transcriptional repressor [Campylobacter sp.]MDA3064793.1 transcriptional repressor [Campylobacter sp. CN_NE4]MDA3068383.1 transcriptional repressor [Campylobacter sp. CN_NE3]MDA3082304.1 transcriptional repressor [Campylobacter sp. CN_EL2]MDA3083939.1 transcriptional repressor [Campylobacter sp. CN_NE1]